ncbi:uncharacterized protein MONOS_7359 [Monocercomonoides exilis]|uniref:uncharacterized protein n=1 Tax=Monocercomonoides exilis TaxID=2049356 RepID=UPI00355A8D47|nr:hypothetical protein MONOS_7359 [Monocercomonoides exilis]|eukprot:MONOS_7359.1-p1 / transcript=MONOS_7359.1 / gene=MONOS_7359 / organism=Monocercomonoides_exilis_PA203 / gene_product=unspecified product / transcript_product=unspecified product / location=Mono_scaffold00249:58778-59478(+) / protein_length=194 / sequence_SO=supercontig / SO=protein_coding / is_pseudo=false
MQAEAAAGLLKSRLEQILKESELETDMASARRRYRSFEAMLKAKKQKRDFRSSSPVQAPSKGGAATEKDSQPDQIIGGRMVLFSKEWEEIGGGDLIRNGIQAMWKNRSEREKLSKMSYRDGAERTSEEHRSAFKDLLELQTWNGIVEEINQEDVKHRNNVFLIKKKNGTWRQIFDCSRLNAAALRTHFKCDNE